MEKGRAEAGRERQGLGRPAEPLAEPLGEGPSATSSLGFLSSATNEDVPARTPPVQAVPSRQERPAKTSDVPPAL